MVELLQDLMFPRIWNGRNRVSNTCSAPTTISIISLHRADHGLVSKHSLLVWHDKRSSYITVLDQAFPIRQPQFCADLYGRWPRAIWYRDHAVNIPLGLPAMHCRSWNYIINSRASGKEPPLTGGPHLSSLSLPCF